jgi:hypothetical protein
MIAFSNFTRINKRDVREENDKDNNRNESPDRAPDPGIEDYATRYGRRHIAPNHISPSIY